MIKQVDSDHNGQIDYVELVKAWKEVMRNRGLDHIVMSDPRADEEEAMHGITASKLRDHVHAVSGKAPGEGGAGGGSILLGPLLDKAFVAPPPPPTPSPERELYEAT